MQACIISFLGICLILLLSKFHCIQAQNDTSICTRTMRYAITVTKLQPYRKQVTAKRWNGQKYVKWVNDSRIVTQIEWATRKIETCCNGYTRYKSKCIPLCDEVCENSKCTSPNVCTCNEGYVKFTNFRCVPHCENCRFGSCIAPNYCQCFSNYEKDANGTCQPKCVNACINSYCAHPDFCMCFEGYKISTQGTHICEPVCEPSCRNAKCIKPNECECLEGYEKSNETEICSPICENCENGNCVSPGICECYEGYKQTNEGCEPICEPNCENADCISPNVCECHSGYEENNLGKCVPICTDCENGVCVAPDECECNEGYSMNEEEYCEPVCEPNCTNGNCTSPDYCDCYDGYEKVQPSWHICEPVCRGCVNGNCLGPNECQCHENFVWDEYSFMCVLEASETSPEELNAFDMSTEIVLSETSLIKTKCICNYDEINDCTLVYDINCEEGKCDYKHECICNGKYSLNETIYIDSNSSNVCECFERQFSDYKNETYENFCIPQCGNNDTSCITPNICEYIEDFELSYQANSLCTGKSSRNMVDDKGNIQKAKPSSIWWILCLSIAISILGLSILSVYFYKKMFRKRNYYVGKRENFSGVQYTHKDEDIKIPDT